MTTKTLHTRLLGYVALSLSLAAAVVAFAPGAGAGNGADGSTYVLSSFDGVSLLGLNDQGRTLTSQFVGTTTYKQARLDKYHPTDPYQVACRAAAAGYNDALVVQTSDGSVLDAAIGSLASGGCKARVVFIPNDPYLPPNPIRIASFQPVP
jgi:hypothetical protein